MAAVETGDGQDHQGQQDSGCRDNKRRGGLHVESEDGHEGSVFRNAFITQQLKEREQRTSLWGLVLSLRSGTRMEPPASWFHS